MKPFDPINTSQNILVLGNGFDLRLKLESSFSDFFKKEVLTERGKFPFATEHNLLLYLCYLRFLSDDDPSRRFFRPVYQENPKWMDIESFIQKIATDPKMLENIYLAMSFRKTGSMPFERGDEYVLKIGEFLAKLDLPPAKYDKGTIKRLLEQNLSDFETRFSTYLLHTIGNRDEYAKKQGALFQSIISSVSGIVSSRDVEVINFNYTKNALDLYEEINVHGSVDSKVVIGYDSTKAPVKDDDIFELSKDWRKIDVDFTGYAFAYGIDSIIVYGHSLGEQDYPLFFEMFDKCHLLAEGSASKLVVCYSVWGDEKNPLAWKKSYDNLRMNAAKLLNAYERYLNPGIARNTIVTKLKSQDRLFFVEVK